MSTQPLHRLRTVRSSHYVWVDARIPVGGEIELAQPAMPRLERLGVEVLDLVADEEMGGLALSDCVINSDNILALRDPCLDALLAELDLGEHERIPSRVLDAQRQVLSDDYSVVNFLERADALDLDRTELDTTLAFKMVKMFGKWSLDPARLPRGRDLFRVDGVIGFICSQRLVDHVVEADYTGFAFEPVPVSEPTPR